MIDISNIKLKHKKRKDSHLSLCGKLEAIVGNCFLSNVSADSKVEILYYDPSVGLYDAVDTAEKNIIACFVENESVGFVKSEFYGKLQKETKEYGITYIPVDDFDKEQLYVDLSKEIPNYLKDILWINDDFMSDDTIPFDQDAFEIIDSKAFYLNPAHFSVSRLIKELYRLDSKSD